MRACIHTNITTKRVCCSSRMRARHHTAPVISLLPCARSHARSSLNAFASGPHLHLTRMLIAPQSRSVQTSIVSNCNKLIQRLLLDLNSCLDTSCDYHPYPPLFNPSNTLPFSTPHPQPHAPAPTLPLNHHSASLPLCTTTSCLQPTSSSFPALRMSTMLLSTAFMIARVK